MRRMYWTVAIVALCVITIVLTSNPGLSELTSQAGFELPGRVLPARSAQLPSFYPTAHRRKLNGLRSATCPEEWCSIGS